MPQQQRSAAIYVIPIIVIMIIVGVAIYILAHRSTSGQPTTATTVGQDQNGFVPLVDSSNKYSHDECQPK